MKRKAFTLIELLVVIAIIAILAAILFPVFAQAKAAAKKTADLSNVKNTTMASILYSGDSDDVFVANGEGMVYRTDNWQTLQPWTGQEDFYGINYGAGAGKTGAPLGFMDPDAVQNWGRETQPYIKSMDMMVSPGAPNDTEARFAPVPNNARAGKTSYVFNGCASNTSQTAISQPAGQIIFQVRATTTREAICVPRPHYFRDGARHANDADLSWVGFNFAKGGNYGYADGHAKFRMRSQVRFKDLGYWEWVHIEGKGWTPPEQNPTMIAVAGKVDDQNWRSWGNCDPSRVPN